MTLRFDFWRGILLCDSFPSNEVLVSTLTNELPPMFSFIGTNLLLRYLLLIGIFDY